MALLNGQEVNFYGLTAIAIGEKLLTASPQGDGVGVELHLTEDEDVHFSICNQLLTIHVILTIVRRAACIQKKSVPIKGRCCLINPPPYSIKIQILAEDTN